MQYWEFFIVSVKGKRLASKGEYLLKASISDTHQGESKVYLKIKLLF